MSPSRGSSRPSNQTPDFCIGRWLLYHQATSEAHTVWIRACFRKRLFLGQFRFSVGNLFPSTSLQVDRLLVATPEYCQGLYLEWQAVRRTRGRGSHFPSLPCQQGFGTALTGEGEGG